jgi:electron transport complex protein RnfE
MSENMADKTYLPPDQRLEEKKKSESPMRVVMNGLLYENAAFLLVLGTCPLLAVTISAKSSFFMGIAVIFVLTGSEIFISMLRNIIPDKVRIPAFIIVIAGFVTIVQMVISAYLPALNKSLGIYIPLIVVNCIVLARAEAFSCKRPVFLSMIDGLSMGSGYMVALVIMGSAREILGNGTFFDLQLPLFGTVIEPMMFFLLPPGGFFVYGICICITQIVIKRLEKTKKHRIALPTAGCDSCGACSGASACTTQLDNTESEVK